MSLADRVGRSIKSLRLSRGMTQSDLASRSGLDRTYISSIEKGDRNPTVDTVAQIAKSLNLTFIDLMEEATEPMSTTSMREAVKGLTEDQVGLVQDYIENMKSGTLGYHDTTSDLISSDIYDSIGNRLLDRHNQTPHKLNKRQFEYVFVGACKSQGHDASIIENSTNPGEDIRVNGTSFSMKTEAAQGIREDKITISKLMEARWIREAETGEDFLEKVNARVVPHLKRYEVILMLRAFSMDTEDVEGLNSAQLSLPVNEDDRFEEDVQEFLHGTKNVDNYVQYDLVEIPRSLLLKMGGLSAGDFKTDYESGSARVSITEDGHQLFQVFFDGSVEKVTVRNLKVSACSKHASWIVPVYAT